MPETAPPKRFVSIGTKMAIATTALLALASTLVYFGLVTREENRLMEAKKTAATMVVNLFVSGAASAVEFDDADAVGESIGHLQSNEDVVFAGVWTKAEDAESEMMADFRREGHVSGHAPPTAAGATWSKEWVSFSRIIPGLDGAPIGQAVVVFSLERERAALRGTAQNILATAVALTVTLIVLLVAVSRRLIITPLDRLVNAAKALEEGDLLEGVEGIGGNDEVGRLAAGFSNMAAAIRDREHRLHGRNRDMRLVLDNVSQGFLTVDLGGVLSPERSAVLDTWFTPPRDGDTLWSYLSDEAPATAEWLEFSWGELSEGFMPLEVILDQLPGSMSIASEHFEMQYSPILDGDELAKVLVVISNVTAEVERRKAEDQQKEILRALDQALKDRADFIDFIDETGRLVQSIQTETSGVVVARLVHTVKGNCGLYGIVSVANLCHSLEEQSAEANEDLTVAQRHELAAEWKALLGRLEIVLGSREQDWVQITREELEDVADELRRATGDDRLAERVLQWQREPVERALSRAADRAQALARRLNRGDIQVNVDGGNVRLDRPRFSEFWSSFTHVVRNAVDHGLEAPEERCAAGKADRGALWFQAADNDTDVVIEIKDNGRGIDWGVVRKKAQNAGLQHETPEDLRDALFADRFSTRDEASEISGRGVGLAALREAVQRLGGSIEVDSEMGRGTTFRFVLPKNDNHQPVLPNQRDLVVSPKKGALTR